MSSLIFYAALAVFSSSPLSSSSICPPCKKIQDCSSNHIGSYSLMEENSPYCPEVEGFTGCLYEKNGSLTKFCFKSGPLEQCSAYNEGTCTGVTESDQDPKATAAFDNATDSTTSAESDTKPSDSNIPQETTEPTNAVNDISNTEPEIDGDEKTEDVLLKGAVETTKIEQQSTTTTLRPCLKQNFANLALMSEAEVASLCCDESDCQDNAGCFQDELSDTFKTYCQCYLGHSLDNSTSSLPMTGDCQDMKTQDCSSTTACYETDDYRMCPYCHVTYKEATIGQYQSGNGIFDLDDPMIFTGSSSECAEETTEVFWYCWYDSMDQVVDLNQAYVLVEEIDVCEHWAYIYTPLACPFAIEQ
eukprot:TRINITY_DN19763_c0_g1_i1.p1 TRINITY_DN19763_c0_g1~~TRINITY_DN19763_c0_g1_i1.p1  ORF type:complete len:359 (-),score=86.60 TRINITY_DN19763_c0_g1_i1:58-1134(-)